MARQQRGPLNFNLLVLQHLVRINQVLFELAQQAQARELKGEPALTWRDIQDNLRQLDRSLSDLLELSRELLPVDTNLFVDTIRERIRELPVLVLEPAVAGASALMSLQFFRLLGGQVDRTLKSYCPKPNCGSDLVLGIDENQHKATLTCNKCGTVWTLQLDAA